MRNQRKKVKLSSYHINSKSKSNASKFKIAGSEIYVGWLVDWIDYWSFMMMYAVGCTATIVAQCRAVVVLLLDLWQQQQQQLARAACNCTVAWFNDVELEHTQAVESNRVSSSTYSQQLDFVVELYAEYYYFSLYCCRAYNMTSQKWNELNDTARSVVKSSPHIARRILVGFPPRSVYVGNLHRRKVQQAGPQQQQQ